MSNKIKKIQAREILDSRGNPTVEVEVVLESKVRGIAAVPSGASTGEFEALELRDQDNARYGGKGVLKACENVNVRIAAKLKGQVVTNQKKIDKMMIDLDGTENKSNLGANAILGVSLACARAGARARNKRLYRYIASAYGLEEEDFRIPVPMFNIINGGKHADSGLSIQEFMILPVGIKGSPERIRAGSEIFQALKKILSGLGQSTGVGDEGGFSPKLDSTTKSFELIIKAIEDAKYKPGEEIFIGIDAASSSFYEAGNNQYRLRPENISLDRDRLTALYLEWLKKYPLISIEDGLNENDWEGWARMKERIDQFNKKIMIVGDDLTVTNIKRGKKADKNKCANAIIIKFNQIGTLTETIDCIKFAKKEGWKVIVSHRSGETCDHFIADLAVATGADFLKAGSLSRGERLAKYNRLMKIEEEIGA
ncbi:MAG: phosphopyruvate hydratase [Candidatus Paceibacterota bacterium]|jgi:enolase